VQLVWDELTTKQTYLTYNISQRSHFYILLYLTCL